MNELKASAKPFGISKTEVWDAWVKVRGNKGAAGVDGQSVAEFEKDLKNNLFRIWNRMSSGTYFPPAVKAVPIPKKDGGTRILGVPTVADRVAQTVVAAHLAERLEPVFHPDSYGYRPGRSALQAVETCRRRCWRYGWVVEFDIRKFFDSVSWDKVVRAVEAHTDARWVVLYVKRWLAAGLRLPDGSVTERDQGTPQGSSVSPVLANLFLHYAFDMWLTRNYPAARFERYADDGVIHCRSQQEAEQSWPPCRPGWLRSGWSCIPARRGSCTARTATAGAVSRTRSSRSLGSRSGRAAPGTNTGRSSPRSCPLSASKP